MAPWFNPWQETNKQSLSNEFLLLCPMPCLKQVSIGSLPVRLWLKSNMWQLNPLVNCGISQRNSPRILLKSYSRLSARSQKRVNLHHHHFSLPPPPLHSVSSYFWFKKALSRVSIYSKKSPRTQGADPARAEVHLFVNHWEEFPFIVGPATNFLFSWANNLINHLLGGSSARNSLRVFKLVKRQLWD